MIRVLPVPSRTGSVPVRFRFLMEPVPKNWEPEPKILKSINFRITTLVIVSLKSEKSERRLSNSRRNQTSNEREVFNIAKI